jgi:ATP-dependent exoDNAse (exonuclease V) beta subunit
VLVRTNNELRDVADLLRSEGFDVVEEGRRQPAVDNPPGVAIRNLIEWLAQPADHYAQEVVAMSPLAAVLRERYGEAWQAVWEGALRDAEELGLSGMVEALVEPLWSEWSAFGQRRAGDVIGALQQLDAAGGTVREAARVLADFEVAQPPGVAAVQVMTVHKSKGLGFDVVMLPEIPDDRVPNRSYFRRAGGKGWVTEVPAEWAREFVPELQEAEAGWSAVQRYEAFCVLYVALTRAKRGIYVFLSPSPSTRKEAPWASQSEWLARSCGSDRSVGIAFEEGDPGGIKSVLKLGKEPKPTKPAPLGKAVPRRARRTPSGDEMHKPGSGGSAGGRRFGSEVHAAFEKVGWIEDGLDGLGGGAAADLVRECLEVGQIRDCFTRRDGFEAQGEVPVETILGGTWMSGVIDRLHIRRDSDGEVVALEVIDFKTDAVDEAEELLQRYSGQLQSYRDALSGIFGLPEDAIRCMLLWTRDKVLVEVP